MTVIRSVCVYCGSALGADPVYVAAAERLGTLLAEAGVGLVYGGGSAGLMGAVARATKAAGGRVVGIIPEFLIQKEGLSVELDERIVVPDMHTRKQMMFQRADAFVALPGGIGTLEELVEMMTWAQLGRHVKPVLVANVAGFWTPLLALLDHMTQSGFLRPAFASRYLVSNGVEDVLALLRAAALPAPAADAVPVAKM